MLICRWQCLEWCLCKHPSGQMKAFQSTLMFVPNSLQTQIRRKSTASDHIECGLYAFVQRPNWRSGTRTKDFHPPTPVSAFASNRYNVEIRRFCRETVHYSWSKLGHCPHAPCGRAAQNFADSGRFLTTVTLKSLPFSISFLFSFCTFPFVCLFVCVCVSLLKSCPRIFRGQGTHFVMVVKVHPLEGRGFKNSFEQVVLDSPPPALVRKIWFDPPPQRYSGKDLAFVARVVATSNCTILKRAISGFSSGISSGTF